MSKITTKYPRFYLANLALVFAILCLAGCAGVPKKGEIAAFDINGVTYYPLVRICEQKDIAWEYDTLTRSMTLAYGAHRINLRAGESIALVDGRPVHLSHPVEIYQGTVAVPEKFREQVLDVVFGRPQAAPKAYALSSKLRKVVIDAGHGGVDPGAIGRSGLREKDVNLDIAKRLSLIFAHEGVEVVMTRSTDKFIPLPKRVEITNNSGADLFISIHANANRVRSLNGFEVYYVSPSVSDSKRALSSAKSAPLNLEKAYFSGRSQTIKAILWDMIYTQSRAESIELSQSICRSMDDSTGVRVIGVKSAGFQVLRGSNLPSVLVETGFLSNSDEECKLKNSYYRQKVAEAVADGVVNYAQEAVLVRMARK